MKFLNFLSSVTAVALATSAAGFFLDVQAMPLFSVAATLFVLLIAARDYAAPAARRSSYQAQIAAAFAPSESMKLAA